MAACAGMTSAIMNPLHAEEMAGVRAANVLNGVDKDCRNWLTIYREPAPEGATDARADRDARRRRRRA
jgi:5-methyltetrahydrofolate--homocysteine methyltransferase